MENRRQNRKYLCKRDHPDRSGAFPLHTFSAPHLQNLPPVVDLRSKCPPPYDQGDLGSCTANALAFAYQFDEMRQGEPDVFPPSRLFIYYNERKMEGTVDQDAGAAIADGVTSMHTIGVCRESEYPYDISVFSNEPPAVLYKNATHHRTKNYRRLNQNLQQLKATLAQGNPFVCGLTLYDSFEGDAVAQTGNVPMPNTTTEGQLGGHAVSCVGYNDHRNVFIFRNSWGTGWGDQGYFYIPYAYVTNPDLANDFWTILSVT